MGGRVGACKVKSGISKPERQYLTLPPVRERAAKLQDLYVPLTGPWAWSSLCPEAVSGRAEARRVEELNEAVIPGVVLDAKRPVCAMLGRATLRASNLEA